MQNRDEESKGAEKATPAKEGDGRLYLLLSLVWMAVIFAGSHQAYSGRITEEYLGAANVPVRKLGHVCEFAILSLLYFKTLASYRPCPKVFAGTFKQLAHTARLALLALVMAIAYACLDEWHQAFVPGRSSSALDVLVDTTGMVIALGLTLLISWRRL